MRRSRLLGRMRRLTDAGSKRAALARIRGWGFLPIRFYAWLRALWHNDGAGAEIRHEEICAVHRKEDCGRHKRGCAQIEVAEYKNEVFYRLHGADSMGNCYDQGKRETNEHLFEERP